MGHPDRHSTQQGRRSECNRPDPGRGWPTVQIEEDLALGCQKAHEAPETLEGVVQVVEHAQTRNEVKALGGERRVPEVGFHHQHVVLIGEIASRRLDSSGAIQSHLGVQVGSQNPGESTLSASGIQSHFATKAAQAKVAKVDLGELLVLTPHLVEGVPFVPEAGKGALGRSRRRGLLRKVEIAISPEKSVATVTPEQLFIDIGKVMAARRASEQFCHPVRNRLRPLSWHPSSFARGQMDTRAMRT